MRKKRKRYTEQERPRVLAAAEREGLSGPRAAKKFGISTLTFYTRRKKASATRDGGVECPPFLGPRIMAGFPGRWRSIYSEARSTDDPIVAIVQEI